MPPKLLVDFMVQCSESLPRPVRGFCVAIVPTCVIGIMMLLVLFVAYAASKQQAQATKEGSGTAPPQPSDHKGVAAAANCKGEEKKEK
mmetsp:Transcript_97212/g.208524  ORF Transcript_97212/g.208524 Transcript_97212/m.208524 type:complete len:88 (-) Transcript_97212:85-348(-)